MAYKLCNRSSRILFAKVSNLMSSLCLCADGCNPQSSSHEVMCTTQQAWVEVGNGDGKTDTSKLKLEVTQCGNKAYSTCRRWSCKFHSNSVLGDASPVMVTPVIVLNLTYTLQHQYSQHFHSNCASLKSILSLLWLAHILQTQTRRAHVVTAPGVYITNVHIAQCYLIVLCTVINT